MNFPNPTLNHSTLILAPMEGVTDAPMRRLLAEVGGFDFAVSEFIRVSQGVIPAWKIAELVPELKLGAAAPLPVQVQLLGTHPELLAETAVEACTVGARAIDLNFGCPSATVIRNRGGAAMLCVPHEIQKITEAVRKRLPAQIAVSAKVRLGWERHEEIHSIAQAVADGGASWLTIHARTRAEFYRPGVTWTHFPKLLQNLSIPIVANGDLFSTQDLIQCRDRTACRHFMIGRGILAAPFLAHEFRDTLGLPQAPTRYPDSLKLGALESLLFAIRRFTEIGEPYAQNKGYVPARVKQWIGMIKLIRPDFFPKPLAAAINKSSTTEELLALF